MGRPCAQSLGGASRGLRKAEALRILEGSLEGQRGTGRCEMRRGGGPGHTRAQFHPKGTRGRDSSWLDNMDPDWVGVQGGYMAPRVLLRGAVHRGMAFGFLHLGLCMRSFGRLQGPMEPARWMPETQLGSPRGIPDMCDHTPTCLWGPLMSQQWLQWLQWLQQTDPAPGRGADKRGSLESVPLAGQRPELWAKG